MIHDARYRATLLCITAVLLLAGCAHEGLVSPDPAAGERGLAADAAKTLGRVDEAVVVPFKSSFFTNGGLTPDESCGDPPRLLNTQDGDGEATHLGRFTVHITFCMDISDLLDDGELTEGEAAPYDNGFGTFTAANGDELWFTIAGAVVPSDHPDYDFEFADPFEFVGGTGRFEGASGEGVTASFVDSQTGRVEHEWDGTVTLLPGKK